MEIKHKKYGFIANVVMFYNNLVMFDINNCRDVCNLNDVELLKVE